jgi:MFS family permease
MQQSISQTRSNLRSSTFEGVCATPWTILSLPGGFLMAGLLNSFFNVGPFWFGMIAAMPSLANALHILLIPMIGRFMRARDLTLSQGWLNTGLWMSGLVAIAFLPTDSPETAGLFFTIFYGFVSLSGSFLAVSWMAWLSDFVPIRIRGRYMGQRNRSTSVSNLCFMLLSLLLLNAFNASRATYITLAAIAVFGRFVSMLMQHRIVSKDPTGGAISNANWTKELAGLRHEKPLIRFVTFGTLAGFFLGFLGAVNPYYAFHFLEASPAQFTSFSIAATLSGTACVRIWGRLIDRHGSIPVLIICFTAWRIGDFGWALLTPNSLIWMYAIWIWGGAMAIGYLLASFNLLLKLIPDANRAAGISLNLALTSIAATSASMLAGIILSRANLFSLDIVTVYRVAILVAGLGSLLSVSILLKMKEPKTNPALNTINGAMRTLRQITVNQGLTFLSNATFIARRKRKKTTTN